MLSQGLGVYHMPNQNTSIGVSGRSGFWHSRKLQTMPAVLAIVPYPNPGLSNITRTNLFGNFVVLIHWQNIGSYKART